MTENWIAYRRNTRGWANDPCAAIHPRILFGPGNRLTPEFVKKYNITHVINCASDEDSPRWFRNEFPDRYACLNAEDDLKVSILEWLPDFENCMDTFLQNRSSKIIYVHCQCGINRSGFLALAYICKKFQYPYDVATQSILTQRPCALTNPAFREQVKWYVKNLA